MSIIAIDTGGTFTDVVVQNGDSLRILKVASTPHDPSVAVLAGMETAIGGPADAWTLLHGSTVATNALLERRGARVALVTNAGFEDVVEIGRQNRPQLYALTGERPVPLVARDDRHGVKGRLGPRGEEIEPLDDSELSALADRIRGADALALCLLHSYANPGHERRVAASLAKLGLPVSVSSELLPEFREYERTSTTVVNAYVAPVMERYLGAIESGSGAGRVRIMGSGGGAIPIARARREAVHTVLSGPAGGVMGALAVAARAGASRILTFDMGGTSTDVSLCPGRPLHTREFSIAGMPVAVPVLDIHTVGAGGGSIARVNAGGALRVGPESAGADPGPICYGRGGRDITVTDANLWLGRLPEAGWQHDLGTGTAGRRLDRESVRAPLEALGRQLGSEPDAAAEGIVAVANAAMERALRVISVERGYDPADFTLVPFGGAAGLHAIALAERLGIPRVLVPPDPGVLSAFGMLVAPVRKDQSRTVLWTAAEAAGRMMAVLDDLEASARASMEAEGIPAGRIEVNRWIDARYRGQSFELTIPAEGWLDAFHDAHRVRYGYERRDAVVEVVTLRAEALAPGSAPAAPSLAAATGPAVAAGAGVVSAGGRRFDTPLYERATLASGHMLSGPCVVFEYSSTFWLPAGWTARVLADGSLDSARQPAGVDESAAFAGDPGTRVGARD